MPRSREDIINGLQTTVDKYADVTPTGAPIVRAPIVKPVKPVEAFPDATTNPLRIHPTTSGKAPIPVTIRGEDRKWLKGFMEE